MSEEESSVGVIYDALNEMFDGKPTDDILTAVGQILVDIFVDDILPMNGAESTDKEFFMYSLWLRKMYEMHRPINQSGVFH